MKKNVMLWIIAFVITIVTAAYQRLTGPTYPITGKINLAGNEIEYKLARSHGGEANHEVKIKIYDSEIAGNLFYKRFKTSDEWQKVPMKNVENELVGILPHQPPAGKLQYYIELQKQSLVVKFPMEAPVVIRFKGDVPPYVLIPHIFAMFFGMMLSTRTGLEFFSDGKNIKKLTIWTLGFLIVGGFILGPIMQKYAFGEYWTGIPFGHDLTDNKTLIAILGWAIAFIMYKKSKHPKRWALFAAIVLMIVYSIPHSVLGSELDYNQLDKENNQIEKINE
ncbi:MAG: hypothetical protein KDC52_03485 [Ignavibacteriae bacterium]|nr:hypothetical protein [Ignavibacteriota bacterium]